MDITVFFLILFVCLAVLIAVFVLVYATRNKITERHKRFIRHEWKKVVEINAHSPEEALIKADKLLAHVLQIKGYQGSMSDKLKKSAGLFADIDGIWAAHKARNKIAHEVGYKLSPADAETYLMKIKSALKNLGVNFI